MGCTNSTDVTPAKAASAVSAVPAVKRDADSRASIASDASIASAKRKMSKASSNISNASTTASAMTDAQNIVIHKRLQKLQELDETTKIPFIMVELRGHGHEEGFIEICGKDEYGVYAALDEWLTSNWGCVKMDAGDLSADTMVPFCDALYKWNGFKMTGSEGMSNMGLSTMRLIHFMSGTLGWTLGVVNGGNVGKHGEVREQQIIFKAPHPMNFVAPHVMVELRSAGYIEVCGAGDGCNLDELENLFKEKFGATRLEGFEQYCDRYYKTKEGIFKERGNKGENNMGLLTTQVCDAVVQVLPGWSLVTLNGGNYGEAGCHREQELVFRWDNHPLQAAPHLLVELRDAGYIEVCGENVDGVYGKLDKWLRKSWHCDTCKSVPGQESFANAKYKWKAKDMMIATGEVTSFFHQLGWQMQVTSQGTVKVKGNDDSREQQIIVRPGASGLGIVEPHLVIELYMGEGKPELYNNSDATQVLANQYVRMYPIGDCQNAVGSLHQFLVDYMGGSAGDGRYNCDVFLSRGLNDNNLGQWTMRVCDFMVDRLGWSFVVCNVCNLGPYGNLREQQLIFRYDGERREVPKADDKLALLNKSSLAKMKFPSYWKIPAVLSHEKVQEAISCEQEEIQALQEMLDATFKRVLTRDRVYEYQANTCEEMPYRLDVVHAFRSENAHLWHRFQQRKLRCATSKPFDVKTHAGGEHINSRLDTGEAYLFHGTNPSSSMSILKTGFVLNNAGKSTGTMLGYGLYLAECSSKSDEYARDDGGNTYPGLQALLVCRCLVGKPMVVQDPGDHVPTAKAGGYDCIVGDREAKVGTYREFVFYDEAQIVPEYTVIYRRQYNSEKVPTVMRRKTSGTTGRCWQVQLNKGWASISPEANRQVIQAMKDSKKSLDVEIGDTMYTFDLVEKTQLNQKTGTKRSIRPPMFG